MDKYELERNDSGTLVCGRSVCRGKSFLIGVNQVGDLVASCNDCNEYYTLAEDLAEKEGE